MNDPSAANPLDPCAAACASAGSVDALNRDCFCLALDPWALHAQLDDLLAGLGMPASLAESHPHLFSALPVYVSRHQIAQVAAVVAAIHELASTQVYQRAVMAWAPEIANFDPGSPGGLLGLDFHLDHDGPHLIEINTNPGGALLNAMLAQAQRLCMPELTVPPTDTARVQDQVLDVLLAEWRLQRGSARLGMVAIVDEAPERQYLYPEFILFRELLRSHGYGADICSPGQLLHRDGRLWLNDIEVDMVYNRLTDFALEQPGNQALGKAYLSGQVVLSPHPRGHAIQADKRNLALLCDRAFLGSTGLQPASVDLLLVAVPATELVTPENRQQMWERRRRLFFKPAAGFGSKASYRGDKLTRRVWDEIGQGVYVAQEIVPPGERHVATGVAPLKVDIRCYAYRGTALLYAARLYQGQTTNFRTPGGGFAPVLTARVK